MNQLPHDPNLDFRLFLKEQLAQRCKKNPAYSLRAFANLMKVSHSTLSPILRTDLQHGSSIIVKQGAPFNLILKSQV